MTSASLAIVRRIATAATFACASGRLLAQHDMHAMTAAPAAMPGSRHGSGTSWLPDSASPRGVDRAWGAWMVSLDGTAFLMYDDQGTKRGDHQLGLTDWEMVMAMRALGGGVLGIHAMTTIEPFTHGGNGYPLLLQTGGTFRHAVMHDRQHPPDALMELAVRYERPVGAGVALSLYTGAVGEPAVGPVTYMHRPSTASDPFTPLGHHWQDAVHQSFGVVTVGVATHALQLEGSLFNPRESDETHPVTDFRGARLDSYAGRMSWAATPRVVASAWWAFLNAHDRLDPTTRMHRYGAAVLTEARGPGGGQWSSSFVWGVNVHHHGAASHELIHGGPGASPHHVSASLLAETRLELGRDDALFARAERVAKNGEELGFSGGDLTALYEVRSLVLGGTHRIASVARLDLSLGARGSVNFIPASLLATYGTRTPAGFAVYAQVTPRRAVAVAR